MSAGKVRYKPLYLQVKDVLLERIEDNVYQDGQRIPTEVSLSKEFGTSVSTIRQAVTLLVNDGLLIKKQGKGTFVSRHKTKLRFFSWILETTRGEKILQDVIALFEKKHPFITIECIPTSYVRARKQLMALLMAGDAPDVLQIQSHWTSYFASIGAIEHLEPLLDKGNLHHRFYEKDLVGGMYQEKLYSVAWGLCPVSMIANKRVLREAGISSLSSPMTFSSLLEVCQALDRFYEGQDKYCYALNASTDQESDFLTLYAFLLAFQGSFVDEQGTVVFNSPGNIKGFRWLRNFVKTVRVYTSTIHDIRKRFARGDIAFITDGPWIKYQLEEYTGAPFENNFEVVLNPVQNATMKSCSWNYNHALAVSSQSQHKRQAALFVDELTNDPEISTAYYSQVGHLPNNRRHLNDPEYTTPFFRAYKRQMAYSSCINAQNLSFIKAMTFCTDAVKKILYNGVDIERELNEKEYYLNMLYSE
jgi:ABC-type glycerol-3-phosphate transport system substrate-binding protein